MLMRSRLSRLETETLPAAVGRFLFVRGGSVSPEDERRVIAEHGEKVGPNDVVLSEQHGDPVEPPVARDEPHSLVIVPVYQSWDDLILALDEEA